MAAWRVVFLTLSLPQWLAESSDVVLSGPGDLVEHYSTVFKTGNRNAASHLWASFILERAQSMSAATLHSVFKGFCPVSGSVLPDNPRTMYKTTLPRVGGGETTGVTRHCCWPCICDLHDFARVDTKTVTTRDGPQQIDMLVLGDPCRHPSKLAQAFMDPFERTSMTLREAAPELACNASGKLEGATYSDHGYPIIGLFFTDASEISAVVPPPTPVSAGDPTFGFGEMCVMRQEHGYNSGMGLIFHLAASIAPVESSPALPLPQVSPDFAKLLAKKVAMPHKFALPPGSHQQVAGLAGLAWKPAPAAGLCALGLGMAAVIRRRLLPSAPVPQSDAEPSEFLE